MSYLKDHIGDVYTGVVTSIANFGIFVQIQAYLVDGLIRYENLLDDWWDVDVKAGVVRGQRSGTKIGIGDLVKVFIARVDVARRELDLAITEVVGRARKGATGIEVQTAPAAKPSKKGKENFGKKPPHKGESRRSNSRGPSHSKPPKHARGRRRGK